MKETRSDNAQSLGLALLLHLLIFGLALAGLEWTRRTAEPMGGGPAVEAEMVDAGQLSARMQAALADRVRPASAAPVDSQPPVPEMPEETVEPQPPQPVQEPAEQQDAAEPLQTAPPPQEDRPDTSDRDEARRDAQARETREREQEKQRKERQAELQKQQQQAAEEKKRLVEQQTADAKAKAEAEAKRKRAASLAAQRAQQLADAQARTAAASNPGPGSGAGQGKDSTAEWLGLVVGEIERQWRRPDDIPRGLRCPIRIKLLPDGEVLSAEVQPSCPYSEANRRTVEAAVKKASPLPLNADNRLPVRDFVVNFYPSR